jgi:histidine ammonia-lyase
MSSVFSPKIRLSGDDLSADELFQFASFFNDPKQTKFRIEFTPNAIRRVQNSSKVVEKILKKNEPVYGINTGFGKFAETKISQKDLKKLQLNLIRSHAAGVGSPLPRHIAAAMCLIRLNTLLRGNSGIQLSTLIQFKSLLENGIIPSIPSRGSVGASGDLAPSAHASLVLIGEGSATISDGTHFVEITGAKALKISKLKPIVLAPKEGLALINGTQLSTALAVHSLVSAKNLFHHANLICSLSLEGLRGSRTVVSAKIADVRNQPGCAKAASEMRGWLGNKSAISDSHIDCGKVQDPYSLRCAPQVHGAIYQELIFWEKVLNQELNSSTDNPLIFPKSSTCISGGNFHAIYSSRASDCIGAALTVLSSISERRIAQSMSSSSSGLPAFLVERGGLNSGFMMAHVTAAALVSESKSLSMPASVDSIPTSDDKEDHVSMGPGAGFKCFQILKNTELVLAIELLTSCQSVDLLRPLKTSPQLERVISKVRENISSLSEDRILSKDIEISQKLIESGTLLE